MSWQIRHKELGVFQGTFLGMGFWYPTTNQPEQGLLKIENLSDAKNLVNQMCCKKYGYGFKKKDVSIEPFDDETQKACDLILEKMRNESNSTPDS